MLAVTLSQQQCLVAFERQDGLVEFVAYLGKSAWVGVSVLTVPIENLLGGLVWLGGIESIGFCISIIKPVVLNDGVFRVAPMNS